MVRLLVGVQKYHIPEIHAIDSHTHDTSQAALWHKRLRHYHSQGIRRMMDYEAVKGLPNLVIPNKPCTICLHSPILHNIMESPSERIVPF